MQSFLHLFPDLRIAVIGDVMLDGYITGRVERISPEAPVPILRVEGERNVPGGAANVAANLASLGIAVDLVGLAGADATRDELIAALHARGDIDCTGVVASAGRRTTRKLRVVGAHQQMVRIDHEDVGRCDDAAEAAMLAAARQAIDRAPVLIVSDYGKGVCSDRLLAELIGGARDAGRIVVVDPKRRDLSGYRGATVITPNRKELSDATGLPCETDEEAAAAARAAQAQSGAAILLTRSEKGMSYFPVEGEPIHIPTVAQDVFDVSGAGDTVVAVFGAALAAGLPVAEAMRLANHAAGIVVSKLGTACVTRDELAAALASGESQADVTDGRLLDRDAAVALRAHWQQQRLTVGFTNGCFDLIHPGHVSLLAQAAERCDRLIVAINADASVARLKGPERPVQNELSRAAVMGAIKGVAAVVIFAEDTPRELIDALVPDLLVKGGDYTVETIVGADTVIAGGGTVFVAELRPGHSTTGIVQRLTASERAGLEG